MSTAQVILTEKESQALRILSGRTGKTEEELIHDAVVRFLEELEEPEEDWRSRLKRARGIWKDRDDLPDLRELREESNRYG